MKLEPGQVWEGESLSGFEPDLHFYYILLSCDFHPKYKIEFWKVAVFHKAEDGSFFGASVKDFTEEEIRRLTLISNLADLIVRYLVTQ